MAPLPPGDVFAKNVQGMRGVSRAKGALIRGELYASKHRHAAGKGEKIQKDKINLVLCLSTLIVSPSTIDKMFEIGGTF